MSLSIESILVEYVVLIPLEKTSTLNVVLLERRQVTDITDKNILHIGSGRNVDFIIYKNSQPGNDFLAHARERANGKQPISLQHCSIVNLHNSLHNLKFS